VKTAEDEGSPGEKIKPAGKYEVGENGVGKRGATEERRGGGEKEKEEEERGREQRKLGEFDALFLSVDDTVIEARRRGRSPHWSSARPTSSYRLAACRVTTRRLSSSLVAARRTRATLWHTGRFEARFEHKDRALLDPESGSAQEYRFGRDPPIRTSGSESRRIRSNSAPAVPINLFFGERRTPAAWYYSMAELDRETSVS